MTLPLCVGITQSEDSLKEKAEKQRGHPFSSWLHRLKSSSPALEQGIKPSAPPVSQAFGL